MTILSSYDDVIRSVAEQNDIPFELVKELLALEAQYGNLHTVGARPALRRAVAEIIDRVLAETASE